MEEAAGDRPPAAPISPPRVPPEERPQFQRGCFKVGGDIEIGARCACASREIRRDLGYQVTEGLTNFRLIDGATQMFVHVDPLECRQRAGATVRTCGRW